MAGQYNYPVGANPPPYTASQQQFQPGVRLSQQQQGPLVGPQAPQPPAMMMAAPSAPLLVPQPAVEPRFNPCLCCNIISAPGTSLRRGATLVGIGHMIHGFVALSLWLITVSARYDLKFGDEKSDRDRTRIYRRLKKQQAYNVWTLTNILVFYLPCAILVLIAAARMSKLVAGTYVIWNISGAISYIISLIVESVIVHDLGRKVYFETGEDAFARYRSVKTFEGCVVVIVLVYFLSVGASLYDHLRHMERQQGVVVVGPAAAAPVAQMPGVYATANGNQPADESVAG